MTDQILYGPDGYQRTFTHASLAQITLQLSASTQSWVQMEDDTVATGQHRAYPSDEAELVSESPGF